MGRTADDSCAGTLIFSKAIRDKQDRKIGELNVYYNAANKVNCARTSTTMSTSRAP